MTVRWSNVLRLLDVAHNDPLHPIPIGHGRVFVGHLGHDIAAELHREDERGWTITICKRGAFDMIVPQLVRPR